jgi:bifunctional DNA-binding transcriptional regulator/antitoxin component of YhaV-PrlF toxin-antitoxin module
MDTTRLLPKGHIILPKTVRDRHGWTYGMDFAIDDTGDGILLRPLKTHVTQLDDIVGCLKRKGPPRSIEAMNAAIGDELRACRDRGRYEHGRAVEPGVPFRGSSASRD